jgi:hypothetical protein
MEGDQPEAETWRNKLWIVLRDAREARHRHVFEPTRVRTALEVAAPSLAGLQLHLHLGIPFRMTAALPAD